MNRKKTSRIGFGQTDEIFALNGEKPVAREKKKEDQAENGDTTSRLPKANRRARKDMNDPEAKP